MIKKIRIVIIILIVLYIIFGFYTGLEITNYTYSDADIPKEFDGFRIVFISDFHCKSMGKNEDKLIHAIDSCKPDIVVFTGDMIDGDHKDMIPVKDLLAGLTGKCPIYAASGNHEKDIALNYEKLLEYYSEFGVNDLDNSFQTISKKGAHIGIYGENYMGSYFIENYVQKPNKDENEFNILLYHDATAFSLVSKMGYNLVLSGHTHGGVIRLPLLGGIVNNNGSLFPAYDNGIFHKNGSSLISNRGIGDADFPRFNNRPEVVCITLKAIN